MWLPGWIFAPKYKFRFKNHFLACIANSFKIKVCARNDLKVNIYETQNHSWKCIASFPWSEKYTVCNIFNKSDYLLVLHSILNRSSRRKSGMASNPLFIILACFYIFPMNFAIATLGLKEMGKFLWEGREKVLPCWLSQFSKTAILTSKFFSQLWNTGWS